MAYGNRNDRRNVSMNMAAHSWRPNDELFDDLRQTFREKADQFDTIDEDWACTEYNPAEVTRSKSRQPWWGYDQCRLPCDLMSEAEIDPGGHGSWGVRQQWAIKKGEKTVDEVEQHEAEWYAALMVERAACPNCRSFTVSIRIIRGDDTLVSYCEGHGGVSQMDVGFQR